MTSRMLEGRSTRQPRSRIGSGALLVAALAIGQVLVLWLAAAALIGATGAGPLIHIDQRIESTLAGAPAGTVHEAAAAVTWLGSAILVLPLAVVLAVVARRRRSWMPIVTATVAIAGAEAVTQAVKWLVKRPRPDGAVAVGYAFPSGHATFAAAAALTLALLVTRPRLRRVSVTVALGVIAAVCWSRLALDAHWFSDVVVGALVGASWAIAAEWTSRDPAPGTSVSLHQPAQRLRQPRRTRPPGTRLGLDPEAMTADPTGFAGQKPLERGASPQSG